MYFIYRWTWTGSEKIRGTVFEQGYNLHHKFISVDLSHNIAPVEFRVKNLTKDGSVAIFDHNVQLETCRLAKCLSKWRFSCC